MSSRWGLDTKTYWLAVSRNVTLTLTMSSNPCGGRVEYLHRDPVSRRRQRKGKSQIWDSKILAKAEQEPSKLANEAMANKEPD
jgi:hypothetical protein